MRSTWRIHAATATDWSITWPEKKSQSAVTEPEASCVTEVYRRPTRNPARPHRNSHQSDFTGWLITGREIVIEKGWLTSTKSKIEALNVSAHCRAKNPSADSVLRLTHAGKQKAAQGRVSCKASKEPRPRKTSSTNAQQISDCRNDYH